MRCSKAGALKIPTGRNSAKDAPRHSRREQREHVRPDSRVKKGIAA